MPDALTDLTDRTHSPIEHIQSAMFSIGWCVRSVSPSVQSHDDAAWLDAETPGERGYGFSDASPQTAPPNAFYAPRPGSNQNGDRA